MSVTDLAEAAEDSARGIWPFNVVDAFAYLGQGYLALVWIYMAFVAGTPSAVVMASRYPLLLRPGVSAPLVVIMAYVFGHVLAAFARAVLENQFALRFLGAPQAHAFDAVVHSPQRHRIVRVLTAALGSPEYVRRYPRDLQATLASEYTEFSGTTLNVVHVLKVCAPLVRARSASARARMAAFLNLYTFSRNLAFTLFLLGAMSFVTNMEWKNAIGGTMLGVSAVLTGRYLTFFRLHSDEILLVFSTIAKRSSPSS